MKLKLDNTTIVVEGTTDINFLSSFIDANFYYVNGSAINEKDLCYLQLLKSKGIKIIILTDPDFPGLQIRNKINEYIKGCYNAFVRKECSIKHNKVGVAESNKDEVLSALNNCISFDEGTTINKDQLNENDLFDLGLLGKENSSNLRKYVSQYLKIGYTNGKQFLKRINCLNIKKEELKEIIENAKK